MIEIIPAIIPKDFSDLHDHLEQVVGIASLVQIDILDGTLVPIKSWPHVRTPDSDFQKIMMEEEGFPFWEDIEYEFHLMVKDPSLYTQAWVTAGAKRIGVHYESFETKDKLIAFASDFQGHFGRNGSLIGTDLGLVLNMETDVSVLPNIIEHFDYVQFMCIDTIGSHGMPFNTEVIEKIAECRKAFGDLPISVDGGVTLENAKSLIDAGADRLVVGGAIWNSNNILDTIEKLEDLG